MTTVEVTPPSAALFLGDTLALTAIIKDQHGAALSGKTVTWSSSPLTVASVLANGRVIGVAPGGAVITATVEGKSGSSTITVGPRVTLETASAVSKTIGPAGGTITTTSAAGVSFDFVVPPLALESGVSITVTPISSLSGQPLSHGLAVLGGVDFQPSGLSFGPGVRLVIRPATPIPALGPTQRLIGFTTDGAGKALGVQPAASVSGGFAIFIEHFSTGGLAIAEVGDLTTLPSTPDGSIMRQRIYQLALAQDLAAAVAVFKAWRAEIEPLINLAQTGTDAKIAIDLFLNWEETLTAENAFDLSAALAGDLAALATATQLAMKRGIAALNQQCAQFHTLLDAKNVLYLQQYAEVFSTSLTGIGTGLSQQAVLATLCIQSVQSFSRFQDFTANSSAALDLTYGVKFGGNPALDGAFFDVTLTVSGAANNGVQTIQSNAGGQLPQTLIATGTTPITIQIKACLARSQNNTSSDLISLSAVCHFSTLTANPTPPPCGVVLNGNLELLSAAQVAAAANIKEIRGGLGIGGFFATIGTVDLPCLERVVLNPSGGGGSLQIGALKPPGIVRLSGLRSVFSLDIEGAGLVTLELPALTQAGVLWVLGTSTLRTLALPNLAINSDGLALSIGSNSALETVTIGPVVGGQFIVGSNPALRTLTAGSINAISVQIYSNPELQDLVTGTMTGSSLLVFGNGLTTLAGIAGGSFSGFIFGAADPLGEAAALAFANRVTVLGVCSRKPDGSFLKCYTGPPWH